jgi:adenylosuccinate synthase
LILSGPLCSGKTTLASTLAADCGYDVISVRASVRALSRGDLRRRADLQEYGAELERLEPGIWLARIVSAAATSLVPTVVDAVRTLPQVVEVKRVLPRAVHVHLTADIGALHHRFLSRAESDIEEPTSFTTATAADVERHAGALQRVADVVIDTSDVHPRALVERVMSFVDASS